MTILEDYTAVEKEGDDYFFVTRYKEKLDPDVVKKRIKVLMANVVTLKKDLKEMDIPKGMEAFKVKLEMDREVKKEALQNFDKYISDSILDIKRNKENQRNKIRQELLSFDVYKEKQLERFQGLLESKKLACETQLKDDRQQLEAYEGKTSTTTDN